MPLSRRSHIRVSRKANQATGIANAPVTKSPQPEMWGNGPESLRQERGGQTGHQPNDVESDQQRQRNCVEGTRRRWYGEDERTGRDPASSRHRGLNKSATNIPSECRIASIGPDDAMILPHDANPGRIKFSERTGRATVRVQKIGA